MNRYPNVFTPIKIGNLEIKNRIEIPPMTFQATDSIVTPPMIEFYQSLARGGAGILTVGDSAVDFDYGGGHLGQLNIGQDRIIVGLSSLVEAVHKYGAKLSIELNHGGRRQQPKVIGGRNPIGPSPVPTKTEEANALKEGRKKVRVTEMNQDMIDQVIENYANACFRCMTAGMEMVMIHGAHGHLLSQFVSPYANKRTDNYGGSLENRARFVIEVLTAIRKKVGNKLALEYRISGDEMIPEGMHEDETIEFIKIIEDKIDLVHISLGLLDDMPYAPYHIQPTYLPHNYNVHRAEKVKKAVKIPVTCVGSVTDLESAEQILKEGKADIVAMGRSQLADPELIYKSVHGQPEDVRPCLRCCVCLDRLRKPSQIRCAINPITGREVEYKYIPAAKDVKKVVIIGGGPGGMEAAQIASSRGHKVTLYEKDAELGGALRYAAAPPFKADMKKYLDWMIKKTKQANVEIKLSTAVTPAMIKVAKADVLFIAVGAEPFIPDIPGIKNSNVLIANDVDIDKAKTGNSVIVAGAGLTGCETALHLAQQGKKVTIIDMIDESGIASDAAFMSKINLLELLGQQKVKLMMNVKLEAITSKGITVIDKNWNRIDLKADTVVLALGVKPLSKTVESLKDIVTDTYIIGDCLRPRNLMNAVHDAFNYSVEI
jgi:2,4-dienoyl-CoA reductase-like NADH-dependent reductase (Old Yellow Enzyme family)/thioredoxin reductase